MKKIVTFGEVMLRLAAPDYMRFSQTSQLVSTFGGGEANVAVSLANFGMPVDFITRLPENDIGFWCEKEIRKHGVCTKNIVWGGERLGIYFLETGAVSRGSNVVYDRSFSAVSEIRPGMIDWDEVFKDAQWFHWTGITPAISESAAQVCLEGAKEAGKKGITVSCDLNFRKKLWKWGKSAGEIMPDLVKECDIILGNEEDAEKVFGIILPEKEPVYDLAKMESTFADGKRSSFTKDGKTYHSLVPDYTRDGGHLNETGREIAAEQLLILMAGLST